MQIKDLDEAITAGGGESFVFDNESGNTKKISFDNLCAAVVEKVATTSTNVTEEGMVADARAIKDLNDKFTIESFTPTILSQSAISSIDRNVSFTIPSLKLCILSFRVTIGSSPQMYTDVIGNLPHAHQNRQYAVSNSTKGVVGAVSVSAAGCIQITPSLNAAQGNTIDVAAVYMYN